MILFVESLMHVKVIFPMKFCSFTINTGAGLIVPEIQDDKKVFVFPNLGITTFMCILITS